MTIKRCALGIGVVLLGACQAPAPDPMAWTLGEWEGTRRAADDGQQAPMTVRVEPLPGQRGQIECLEVEGSSGTYVGFATTLEDADTGRWIRLYTNGSRRTFSRMEAQLQGARSIWRSFTPGRRRESRLITERLPDGGWRKTQEVSEDGGETWTPLFTDELVPVTGM